MEQTDKPAKILVCTNEIPQSVNAGSQQLYRSFNGYPADCLFVLGPAPHPDADLMPCQYRTIEPLGARLARTRFQDVVTPLNALGAIPDMSLGKSVELTREFRPDVVFTVMDKLSWYSHAWRLADRLGCPLAALTMDDPRYFEKCHPKFQGVRDRAIARIYRSARTSMGVSPQMCQMIEGTFGKPTDLMRFGAPAGLIPRDAALSTQLRQGTRLTLGYAGSLGLHYDRALVRLLPILEQLDINLAIFSGDRHLVPDHPLIQYKGRFAAHELWPAVQDSCDALILFYGEGDDIAPVYRTHFPTKIAEYCWAGMPIVAYGPEYATGVTWAREHPDAAIAISSHDQVALDQLRVLQQDGNARTRMSQQAAVLARSEFDPESSRLRFQSLLQQAADPRQER